jgi:hypothetical protein
LASGCAGPGHGGGFAPPRNSLRISVRNWLASRPPEVVLGFAVLALAVFFLVLGLLFAFAFVFDFLAFVLAFLLAMTLMSPFWFDGPGRRQPLVCLQTEWMRTDASHQPRAPAEGGT